MIVEYASWEVASSDHEGFTSWMGGLAAQCSAEDGCLAYDFRIDPSQPNRGSLFQAWESQEAFERHLKFPAHQEMLADDSPYRTKNVRILRWSDARGYAVVEPPQ